MISIERLESELREKVPKNKLLEVKASYLIACDIHKDQFRESGEPYIIHPLNVANNLLNMGVYDSDTICAALLHDTIEDAKEDFTKEDIAQLINPTVAELVDGVTKISRMNFSTKNDQNKANTRKIINGLTKDVRIILIKLADRLHNMETLQYKKPEKQFANAMETMELFVPLALTIGSYRMKNKLEELSLQYIAPEDYKYIKEKREEIEQRESKYLKEMASIIRNELSKLEIENTIVFRDQSLYTLYKKIKKGYELENVYDLAYFKILVRDIEDCYRALYVVHRNNPPINGRMKDYICNPRTNFYQSLHTTVSDANGKFRKVKIRTYDMEKIAAYGIPAYWNIENAKTLEETQEYIRQKCQFAKKLMELDESYKDDNEFVKELYSELLTDHIYVYTHSGEIKELPQGATALDFAVQVYPEELDRMTGVLVNSKEVKLDTPLKNNDRVQIKTDGKINRENWESYAKTPTSIQKIKQLQANAIKK